MNDLGDLDFNQYAITHNQSDLIYIYTMVSSIDAFAQVCQPSYDMKYIGTAPHLRSFNQSGLQFIYIMVRWVVTV